MQLYTYCINIKNVLLKLRIILIILYVFFVIRLLNILARISIYIFKYIYTLLFIIASLLISSAIFSTFVY